MNHSPQTPGRRGIRPVRMLASAVLLGGLLSTAGLAGAAVAVDGQDTDFTVTIPSPAPTTPPATTPPTTVPPASAGTVKPAVRSNVSTPAAAAEVAPAACVPAEPAVPTVPAKTGEPAAVDKRVYEPGRDVTATASGYGAGEQVQLVMFSEPALVGSFTADAQGQVQAVFPVDEKTLPGTHALQFTGWCKKIALTSVLVASDTMVAAGNDFPVWVWGVGGVAAAALLAIGGWQLIRFMRPSAQAAGV